MVLFVFSKTSRALISLYIIDENVYFFYDLMIYDFFSWGVIVYFSDDYGYLF